MNAAELQQHFSQAQADNEFSAARTTWNTNQARAVIFFRSAWRSREAAYSFALYLPDDGAYVAVEQSLDPVFAILRRHGYADELWQDVDRLGCHHHIAPIDEERLWNAGYGVVRQQGLWREATITIIGPVGAEKRPGKELVGSGLGYWMDNDEPIKYAPTHLASGCRCGPESFYSEEQCQKYIEALAPLMNWKQDMKALTSDPAYQPEKFGEINKHYWIEDAGASAGGGRW